MPALPDDEFRLLAYMRGYADHVDQHLDPGWVREQLEFSDAQMRRAAHGLSDRGLVELSKWSPAERDLAERPEIGVGPYFTDIRVTERGWDCLKPTAA